MRSRHAGVTSSDPFAIEDKIILRIQLAPPWQSSDQFSLRLKIDEHDADRLHVVNQSGGTIATARNAFISEFMRSGGEIEVSCQTKISAFSAWLFGKRREKTLRLLVRLKPFNWQQAEPFLLRNLEISEKITLANQLARLHPEQAVASYRDAIEDIYDMHFESEHAHRWRRVPYPVTELVAILAERGDAAAAYDAILAYESFDDRLGLCKKERLILAEQKQHLARSLMLQDGFSTTIETGQKAALYQSELS
jgi:hypothetical protein